MSDHQSADLGEVEKLNMLGAILEVERWEDETNPEFIQRLLDEVDDHIIALEELRDDIAALGTSEG